MPRLPLTATLLGALVVTSPGCATPPCQDIPGLLDRQLQESDPQRALARMDSILSCGAPALTEARARLARPDLDPHALRDAITIAGALGTDEDGRIIAALLTHPDPGVHESAALALMNNFSAGTGAEAIAAALRVEPRLETRVLLVRALARTRDPAYRDLYNELAVTTADDELARVTAYGRLGEVLNRAIQAASAPPPQ